MNSFSSDDGTRLQELLEEETDIFRQIRELTRVQKELLAADDIDGFNSALDDRLELIEKINGLHQETNLLMQSYKVFKNSPGGSESVEIENAVALLQETIAETVELDGSNAVLAKRKAEEYIKQIGKLSLTRKSIGKYAPGAPTTSALFDRKT